MSEIAHYYVERPWKGLPYLWPFSWYWTILLHTAFQILNDDSPNPDNETVERLQTKDTDYWHNGSW